MVQCDLSLLCDITVPNPRDTRRRAAPFCLLERAVACARHEVPAGTHPRSSLTLMPPSKVSHRSMTSRG